MKKKALHVLMAVGIFAAAASMFVSCKDNMGDEMEMARAEIKYLNDLIDYQATALKADLEALRQAQEQCKINCNQRMNELQNLINQLQTKDAELQNLINQLQTKDSELETKLGQLEQKEAQDIAALQGEITNLKTDITNLKNEITNIKNEITNVKNEITNIKNDITSINTEIAGLKAQDTLLQNQINTINTTLTEYNTRITNNETNITNLTNLYNTLNQTLTEVKGTAEAADQLSKLNSARIDSLAKADKDSINSLKQIINTINNNVLNLQSQVNNLRDSVILALAQADAAYQFAYRDSLAIEELKAKLEDYYTKAEIDTMYKKHTEAIAKAQEVADSAYALAGRAYSLADNAMTTATAALDSAKENRILIKDLETAMKAADKLLQDSIDAVASDLADLKIDVKKIQDELGILKSDLAKMITSIVMQAVSNPVTGTLITPFGFNTNILCAFYGSNVNGTVDFPVDAIGADAYNLIGCSESFVINSGETLVDDMDNGVANAGKIYATINPNTVSFEGEQLVLETSAGKAAEVELTPLKKSDKEIMFGYTRADNGFYEADATIAYDKIQDAKINKNLNMGELKEIAKSALNELKTKGQGNFNVSDTYVKIMNAVSDVIPAYALKATWKDSAQVEHSIYSKYEIAATALKPLSYEFLAGDWNAPKIPSINYEKLGIKFKLQNAEGVYFHSNTPIYLVYDASGNLVSVHGGWVYGNKLSDNEHAKQDAIAEAAAIGGTWVERNLRNLMDIEDALLIDKVVTDAYVYNINYLEQQMSKQVEDNVKRILNKVNSVIGKINARIQNANYYLQPNVLVKGGDDWYRASQTVLVPTYAGGTGWIMLMPSSNTAELVCPAFKKFVAVTDVVKDDFSVSAKGGDTTCKSILEAANNPMFGMNKVYAGKDPVAFNATETGYIYEVTYASIDYSGYTRTEKVYIRVK